jgi:uncharacterized hydrophobic protein (TIGR00271 family)
MLLVGDGVESRAVLVAGMLRREPREAAAYWLKLVVAVGIATLGLVVGSTAVIIGAMLIAPLMTPIVGLALGLATGSPFLVLRSSGRIVFSVVLVILGAAAITLLVPIHELNAEISSRASPTVLDLAIAVFCALAGVLASLRPGSDTATTAAGTSISVSLVPPLCASGYGVGTGAWSIAAGAALLFLTNLVAIALVGTCAFVLAGFNRVDVVALERRELAEGDHDSRVARWLAKKLSRLFASRGGPLLRLAMPVLLLATVYLPLRRALDEVAWEVRVRAAVRSAIAAEQPRVLESRLVLDRHQVELGFVVLGTMKESERVRERVKAAVQRASGVVPQLEVRAVPDAAAFAGLESSVLSPKRSDRPLAIPAPSPAEQIERGQALVRAALSKFWPAGAAGAALAIDVSTADDQPLRVRVVHIGQALGASAMETLQHALEDELGRPAELVDVAVPAEELTRAEGDLTFVARVTAAIRATSALPGVSVCVTRPPDSETRAPGSTEFAGIVEQLLATAPHVLTTRGDGWRVRFQTNDCPGPPAVSSAGADAAAGAPGSPAAPAATTHDTAQP